MNLPGDSRLWISVAVAALFAVPLCASTPNEAPIERAVCMAGSPVDSVSNSTPITVIVPPERSPILADRGFTVVPCLENPVAATKYRQDICQFADTADASTQEQLTQTYRVSPREMCDFANELGL